MILSQLVNTWPILVVKARQSIICETKNHWNRGHNNTTERNLSAMDIGRSNGNGDVSVMYNLGARIRSFQTTSIVDGKKFRWRYTVIPYQGMARLGFFFHPFQSSKNDEEIYKDAVQCICCKNITYNFGDCRSKKKDIVETMISVLRQHLKNNECILSELKLEVLEDHLNEFSNENWSDHLTFGDPMSQKMLDFRESTFLMNWDPPSDSLLPACMSQAGLLRYDSSYTGFEELMENDAQDACYCVYCKRIVGSWQPNDDPLLEHYRSSNGGMCYFFDKMRSDSTYNEVISELETTFACLTNDHDSNESNIEPHEQEDSPLISQEADAISRDEELAKDHDLAHADERPSSIAQMKEESISRKQTNKDEIQDNGPPSPERSPARKKRILRRLSTRKYFDDRDGDTTYDSEHSFREEKDLVIEFKERTKKARDIGRTNKILDDSNDEFSFSAQGHSAFEIPTFNSILPSNNISERNEITDERVEKSLSDQSSVQGSPKEKTVHPDERNLKLDDIPIDAVLSSDSSLDSNAASSPSRELLTNLKEEKSDHSATELRHLRPLQRCKIN